ncbi:MAG: PKD domain-containing protein, partial [Patescibacteria group bacterium]
LLKDYLARDGFLMRHAWYKRMLAGLGIAGILVFSGVGLAQPVSALTADEIQNQIKELRAKIADLTNQLNELRVQQVPPIPEVKPENFNKHRICAVLHRNLSQGIQGDDVNALQEFLQGEGYFSGSATGYFGPLTAKAVAKWQAAQGVSSIGSFGPMSREHIKRWCDGSGIGQTLQAIPMSGTAPLTVSFEAILVGSGNSYSIDFGDGTSDHVSEQCFSWMAGEIVTLECMLDPSAQHTYTSNGTYTAVLYQTNRGGCSPEAEQQGCLGSPASRVVVGKVQITVGATACTKEYRPICGSKPIVCITTPCNPVPTTYGNRCIMKADGASFSYEGACRSACTPRPVCLDTAPFCEIDPQEPTGGWCPLKCRPRPSCPNSHLSGCPVENEPVGGWCPSTYISKPPVISGFSGPTTLAVNEKGTWKVSASDPEEGPLSYDIAWGDENIHLSASPDTLQLRDASSSQKTTFAHAYSRVGTYTVTVTVGDNAGATTKATATVRVSSDKVACTKEYAPVCGALPGPGCTQLQYDNGCLGGAFPIRKSQTFGNKCSLKAAGAELLHSGVCASIPTSPSYDSKEELFPFPKLRASIKQVAKTSATNISQCKIMEIGHRECGGPASYVIYSTVADENQLRSLVKKYTALEIEYQEYQRKHGPQVSGICSIAEEPIIVLKDGHCQESIREGWAPLSF